MTSSPDPNSKPEPSNPEPSNSSQRGQSWWQRSPRWFKYGLYGTTLGATAVIAGGVGFGWYWVHYQMPGFVSDILSDLLLRPVEVGPVQSVGLTEIRLGKSGVLPRSEDPDSAEAQEVIARWNLWEILNPANLFGDRIIPIHLEFRDATVYVEQGEDGSLVDLTLAEGEDEGPGPVEIQVASVKAVNANVKVIPAAFDRSEKGSGAASNEPVIPLQIVGAEAWAGLENWQDGAPQQILFNTTATLDVAGTSSPLAARGEFRADKQRVRASARGTDLPLDAIAQLAPGPIWVRSGVASGNVSVDYAIDGEWPTLQGTAQVKDLWVDGELLPRSLRVNEGAFRFAEQEVDIDTLRVRYGEVSARVEGTVDLADSRLLLSNPQGSEVETAFDLMVNAPDVGLGELQDTFGLELPIALDGLVAAKANLTGTIDNPTLTGRVNTLGPFQVDQVAIDTFEADFSVRSQRASQLTAGAADGTTAQAGGGSVNRRLDKLPERLAAVFPVEATLEDLRIVPATGGEIVGDATVLLRDRNQLEAMEIADIQGSLDLRSLNLNNLAKAYGAPTTVGLGLVSGQLSATGSPEDWQTDGQLSVLGGTVDIVGNGSDTNFSSRVNWSGIGVQRFASLLPEEVRRQVKGDLAGRARISGELGAEPAVSAQVRTGWAGGSISADGTLRGERWQAIAQVQGAQLASVLPRYGGILSANAQASGDLSGDLNRIRATVSSSLNRFAGGDVNAAVNLAGGQWQATVKTQNIQLARLAPQGTGRWTGTVTAAGPVDALTALDLTPVRAQVNGSLLPGEPGTLLTRPQQDYLNQRLPIAVAARWDGAGVAVDRVQGPGLSATGRVNAALAGGNLNLGPVDLTVDVADVDLEVLTALSPIALPDIVNQLQEESTLLAGNAAFQGRLYGPLEGMGVSGDVQLDGLAVMDSPFEDSLTGRVSGGLTRGLVADLKGDRDRIFVTLNSNFLPSKFEVNWDGAIASGRLQSSDTLEFFVSDLPLERFPLPASLTAGFGTPRGIATAKGTFRLSDGYAQAQFGVDNPGLKTVWGDRAAGNIAYSGFSENKIAIWDTQLRQGDSNYGVRADLWLRDDPRFEGELDVDDGRLEQVLRLLRLTDFESVNAWATTLRPPISGRASDLGPVGINTSKLSVLDQLYKLNEIQALLVQDIQRECQAMPVPQLTQIQGEFDGAITFSGTVATGANAKFDIKGKNWLWQPQQECRNQQIALEIERATVAGTLTDGTLDFEPAEFQNGDTIARYVGLIGQEPNGKFELENFPAELLRRVPQIRQLYAEAPLPLLSGTLNIDASLAGTLGNPNARGQIELLDGRLNQLPVQSATGSFNYSAARLNFGSRILVQGKGDDPIRVSGGLPLPLPISTVQPDSENIRFKASVTNEEFGLISLIVPQFQWLGGEGRADVEIGGTLSQPIANGELTLDNAEVAISELPEPLTGVSGTAQLAGDRLIVNNIQGNLTEGQIRIDGALPLFPLTSNVAPIDKPITVDLDQLNLSLRDLYQGGVNGQVVVNGSAIAPIIGGNIGLVSGRVILPSDPTALGGGGESAAGGDIPVSFDNLEISLGKGLQIIQRPVLNFLARGGLTLNGRLADLKPKGRIEVRRGQVNLFATQFFLERGEPQFVEFRPRDGLDPYLEVKLVANVVESSNNPFNTDDTNAGDTEIRENFVDRAGVGQTVRVRASVEGKASEILNNLALTSRPARSEGQILALIGGSLANSVGDESSGTVAIANLAGASLLNTIQSNIANTLGLTDFRVYPTVVTSRPDNNDDDEDDDVETNVGIALELGFDITNRLSASVAQVFSVADTTTRLNLNYRLNENTLIRGSTDFTG
ncbi:MAG: translocation/assembly module TamB domain-containing protein, partial [Cyanobacteria bacterium P01_D01_bin.73]